MDDPDLRPVSIRELIAPVGGRLLVGVIDERQRLGLRLLLLGGRFADREQGVVAAGLELDLRDLDDRRVGITRGRHPETKRDVCGEIRVVGGDVRDDLSVAEPLVRRQINHILYSRERQPEVDVRSIGDEVTDPHPGGLDPVRHRLHRILVLSLSPVRRTRRRLSPRRRRWRRRAT